jgi:hypothetical protein
MKRALLLCLVVGGAACRTAPVARPTIASAARIEAPAILVTDLELTKPLRTAPDPRRAFADKASVEALMAWVPNDTKALLVRSGKASSAPVDRMLEPLHGILPRELLGLLFQARELPGAVRAVAPGAEGPIVLRASEEGPLGSKTAIVHLPKGTKELGDRKVFGLAAKDNDVLSMPLWTMVVLDESHVALTPRAHVDSLAKAVVDGATGHPAALLGKQPSISPSLVAQAWTVAAVEAPIAYATVRIEESAGGETAMRVSLLAAEGEGDKLAKRVRGALRKADGPAAGDFRRAKTEVKGDEVALDVTFGAKALVALAK